MFTVRKTKCVKIHYSSTLQPIPSFPKYKQYTVGNFALTLAKAALAVLIMHKTEIHNYFANSKTNSVETFVEKS